MAIEFDLPVPPQAEINEIWRQADVITWQEVHPLPSRMNHLTSYIMKGLQLVADCFEHVPPNAVY